MSFNALLIYISSTPCVFEVSRAALEILNKQIQTLLRPVYGHILTVYYKVSQWKEILSDNHFPALLYTTCNTFHSIACYTWTIFLLYLSHVMGKPALRILARYEARKRPLFYISFDIFINIEKSLTPQAQLEENLIKDSRPELFFQSAPFFHYMAHLCCSLKSVARAVQYLPSVCSTVSISTALTAPNEVNC